MIDVDNLSHRQIFKGHDLAKPIEGNLSNVKSFTHRDLRRYQKRLLLLLTESSRSLSQNTTRICGSYLNQLLVRST